MKDQELRALEFEQHRSQLRSVAYRMLGSLHEADDAVQETWVRFARTDTSDVDNLGGWLTTVCGRVCLNMLRARGNRREELAGQFMPDPVVWLDDKPSPEDEALLADSVGLALHVVLETLAPAERLAFVLHDMFGMPFEEIAPLVGRSTDATRQLASRGRRRVQGAAVPDADLNEQRRVVESFFAAARDGDLDRLVAVLAPDVVLRTDSGVRVAGPETVASRAMMFADPLRIVQHAIVNGAAGALITVDGEPFSVMAFTVVSGRIVEIDVIAEPERLARVAP
jgi:RNA polymerase sigma-70 factor (ECF subfamily)